MPSVSVNLPNRRQATTYFYGGPNAIEAEDGKMRMAPGQLILKDDTLLIFG